MKWKQNNTVYKTEEIFNFSPCDNEANFKPFVSLVSFSNLGIFQRTTKLHASLHQPILLCILYFCEMYFSSCPV